MRKPIQPVAICFLVHVRHEEIGLAHARIGQRQPRHDAPTLCCAIDSTKPQGTLDPGDQDKRGLRRGVRRRPAARRPALILHPQPVCGQERKPDRQISALCGIGVGHGPTPDATKDHTGPIAGAAR